MEQALIGYVKAQALISLIIGASAGIGLYLLGVLGWARACSTTHSSSGPGSR